MPCLKSVSYLSGPILFSFPFLNETYFKCHNLNFVYGQVIKNANKSWLYCNVPKTYFCLPMQIITNYLLRDMVKHELRVTSCELQVTSY